MIETALTLKSPAFADGGVIPATHARKGGNASPPMEWNEPPAGTKSMTLLVVDEKTPLGLPITHWVVFGMPASTRSLAQGMPCQARFPDGTVQGRNWSGRHGYIGPEPPWGKHLYSFTLYALDIVPHLMPATDRRSLMRAMRGHILAQSRLVGYYSRG